MKIIEIAKQCAYRTSDDPITTLFSNEDNSLAWKGYLQQAAKAISKEHPWQKLRRQAVINTAGNTDTYPLPDDFMDMTTYRLYNITNNRMILSETDDQAFARQAMKSYSQSTIQFRILGDNIVFTYAIEDGIQIKYAYTTKNIAKLNTTYKEYFTDDNDEFLLSDELLILKTIALRAVDLGLPEVNQRQQDYQNLLREEMNTDGANLHFNLFHRGYLNKTTPVEYSAYDCD